MSPALALLLLVFAGQDAAPASATPAAQPTLEEQYPIPAGAPSDDYGLVAWCYGALDGHMRLYDTVIGDVERIEVEIAKIPGAPPPDMESYRTQRQSGKETLQLFRRAMESAEKASASPIAPYGAENLRKGASIWQAAGKGDKRYLAREWMSWGLPGRCLPTAERLEARSSLFGQAIGYNAKGAPVVAPPPEVLEAQAREAEAKAAAEAEAKAKAEAEAAAAAEAAEAGPATGKEAGPSGPEVDEEALPEAAAEIAPEDGAPGGAPTDEDGLLRGADASESLTEETPADPTAEAGEPVQAGPTEDPGVAADAPDAAVADTEDREPTAIDDLLPGNAEPSEADEKDTTAADESAPPAEEEGDEDASKAPALRGPQSPD